MDQNNIVKSKFSKKSVWSYTCVKTEIYKLHSDNFLTPVLEIPG